MPAGEYYPEPLIMTETPTITTANRAYNAYDNCGTNALQNFTSSGGCVVTDWSGGPFTSTIPENSLARMREQSLANIREQLFQQPRQEKHPVAQSNMPQQAQRRIVQVFIVDPDTNVPLEKAVIHKGEEQLTELLDNELFFECPVKDQLAAHNIYRATLLDKDASKKAGKDIHLEPIKVRDLKMVVVTVASF